MNVELLVIGTISVCEEWGLNVCDFLDVGGVFDLWFLLMSVHLRSF